MDISKKGIKKYKAAQAARAKILYAYEDYVRQCVQHGTIFANFTSWVAYQSIMIEAKNGTKN